MPPTESVRLPVRTLTLSFRPVLESGFREYYTRSNRGQVILAIAAGIAVIGVFGWLDYALAPENYRRLWQIRYLYTIPFLVVALVLVLIPRIARHAQIITFFASLGTGAGIIMISTIAGEPVRSFYYAGLMLTFMFVFGFSRLRFTLAVSVSFLLVGIYEFSAIVVAPLPPIILLNNNFFLLAGFIVCAATSYSYEYSVRKAFFLDRLLRSERQKLESMYEDLEHAVTVRTGQLKEANDELERLALYDPLTGLHNRRSLNTRLRDILVAARRQQERSMALLYLDLDFFKDANDSYGHDVGDEILCQVAQRLRDSIRETDYACRLGGDEMIVFLSHITKEGDAAIVAEKLLRSLSRSYVVRDDEIAISASIGVSVFPRDGDNLVELLRAADAALRAAKRQRGTYTFYSDSLDKTASERIRLIGQLRSAIEHDELFLVYQPIVDRDGRAVAAEALLRWASPDRGIVPPIEFIPVLEDTGLIRTVGKWLLLTACTEAAGWADRGNPLRVSINVSPVEFRDGSYQSILQDALEQSGLPPELLQLEITESLLVEDVDDTVAKIRSISSTGVSFAIDDFGTGYSSLSYLRDFPVAALKIDATFTRGLPSAPKDRAIVRSVVSMALGLGLKTVAEGVETKDQFAALRDDGCDTFQGYLFSKPAGSAEVFSFAARKSG